MIVVFALLGIGVIAVLAVLLSRPRQLLADDPVPGRPFQPPVAPLTAGDLAAARFPVVLRGYRMADVDAYLAAAIATLEQATLEQAEARKDEPAAAAPADPEAWEPATAEPDPSSFAVPPVQASREAPVEP